MRSPTILGLFVITPFCVGATTIRVASGDYFVKLSVIGPSASATEDELLLLG